MSPEQDDSSQIRNLAEIASKTLDKLPPPQDVTALTGRVGTLEGRLDTWGTVAKIALPVLVTIIIAAVGLCLSTKP